MEGGGERFYTLGQLAEQFDLRLVNDSHKNSASVRVTGFANLQAAESDKLSFLSRGSYRKFLPTTKAAAVLLREQDVSGCPVPCLVSENPYLAYAAISALFARDVRSNEGVHPAASVSASAVIGRSVVIGPYAIVEEGAEIGENTVIGAGSFVGKGVRIGRDCLLHARVCVYHDVIVGDRVVLHAGSVIGADGFGFAADKDGGWRKIHQLGRVVIGSHVEIGANTCIDRGAIDDTVIDDGVIVDNLVQIAHNVRIGKNTAIAACTGIAGSTVIGANCTIAGAVGIVGHVVIADGVHITAKSLVTGSVSQPGSYSSGTALQPTGLWRKNAVRFLQLDGLFGRVRKLESRKPIN